LPSLIDSVILALVVDRPSYGYELHERFERRFGEFVSIRLANVYDALRRLEKGEYVEVVGHSGSRGRPRVNYRATTGGIEACQSWLVERLREDPQRLALLSRLASTSLRRANAMLEVIDRYEEECMLEARQIAMPVQVEDPASSDATGELLCELIVEQRRRVVDAQLEWCAYARSQICERMGLGEVGG
jgi:DNA-binding PadR family transcriptional regulator